MNVCKACGSDSIVVHYYDDEYLEFTETASLPAEGCDEMPAIFSCRNCMLFFGTCRSCKKETEYISRSHYSDFYHHEKNAIIELLREGNFDYSVIESDSHTEEIWAGRIIISERIPGSVYKPLPQELDEWLRKACVITHDSLCLICENDDFLEVQKSY